MLKYDVKFCFTKYLRIVFTRGYSTIVPARFSKADIPSQRHLSALFLSYADHNTSKVDSWAQHDICHILTADIDKIKASDKSMVIQKISSISLLDPQDRLTLIRTLSISHDYTNLFRVLSLLFQNKSVSIDTFNYIIWSIFYWYPHYSSIQLMERMLKGLIKLHIKPNFATWYIFIIYIEDDVSKRWLISHAFESGINPMPIMSRIIKVSYKEVRKVDYVVKFLESKNSLYQDTLPELFKMYLTKEHNLKDGLTFLMEQWINPSNQNVTSAMAEYSKAANGKQANELSFQLPVDRLSTLGLEIVDDDGAQFKKLTNRSLVSIDDLHFLSRLTENASLMSPNSLIRYILPYNSTFTPLVKESISIYLSNLLLNNPISKLASSSIVRLAMFWCDDSFQFARILKDASLDVSEINQILWSIKSYNLGFKQMVEVLAHLKTSQINYSTMYILFKKLKDIPQRKHLLARFKEIGIPLTPILDEILGLKYEQVHSIEQVLSSNDISRFDKTKVYLQILDYFLKERKLVEGIKWLSQTGIEPNFAILNRLIDYTLQQKDWKSTLVILSEFDQMVGIFTINAVAPDKLQELQKMLPTEEVRLFWGHLVSGKATVLDYRYGNRLDSKIGDIIPLLFQNTLAKRLISLTDKISDTYDTYLKLVKKQENLNSDQVSHIQHLLESEGSNDAIKDIFDRDCFYDKKLIPKCLFFINKLDLSLLSSYSLELIFVFLCRVHDYDKAKQIVEMPSFKKAPSTYNLLLWCSVGKPNFIASELLSKNNFVPDLSTFFIVIDKMLVKYRSSHGSLYLNEVIELVDFLTSQNFNMSLIAVLVLEAKYYQYGSLEKVIEWINDKDRSLGINISLKSRFFLLRKYLEINDIDGALKFSIKYNVPNDTLLEALVHYFLNSKNYLAALETIEIFRSLLGITKLNLLEELRRYSYKDIRLVKYFQNLDLNQESKMDPLAFTDLNVQCIYRYITKFPASKFVSIAETTNTVYNFETYEKLKGRLHHSQWYKPNDSTDYNVCLNHLDIYGIYSEDDLMKIKLFLDMLKHQQEECNLTSKNLNKLVLFYSKLHSFYPVQNLVTSHLKHFQPNTELINVILWDFVERKPRSCLELIQKLVQQYHISFDLSTWYICLQRFHMQNYKVSLLNEMISHSIPIDPVMEIAKGIMKREYHNDQSKLTEWLSQYKAPKLDSLGKNEMLTIDLKSMGKQNLQLQILGIFLSFAKNTASQDKRFFEQTCRDVTPMREQFPTNYRLFESFRSGNLRASFRVLQGMKKSNSKIDWSTWYIMYTYLGTKERRELLDNMLEMGIDITPIFESN